MKIKFFLIIISSIFFLGIEYAGALVGGSIPNPCSVLNCTTNQICHLTTASTARCLNRIQQKCSSDNDCIVETGDYQTCQSGLCYVGDKSLTAWNKKNGSVGCDLKDGSICYHNIGTTDTEKDCLAKKEIGLAKWPDATTKMCYLDDIAYAKYQEKEGDWIKVYQEISPPKNAIRIPGLDFASLSSTLDSEGYIYMPWLGQYISAVYKFALIVASILAVIMILLQGIIIMTGQGMATVDSWDASGKGSKQQKQVAYQNILKVFIGLSIAWGSYSLLYMINPSLVEFKALKVKYIEREEMPEQSAEATYNEPDASDPKAYDKNAMIDKAMNAAKVNGIDVCIVYATMKKESGGNPLAIGHDENYPHGTKGVKCPIIGARKTFLLSGKTYSGTAFTAIKSYSCTDNANTQKNDDKFVNSPPYYGLDWREGISHGIGLSQQTLKPGQSHTSQCAPAEAAKGMKNYPGYCTSSKCTPNEWCKKVGSRWYTVGELLDPDENIKSKITLLQGIMKQTTSPEAIFKKYNGSSAYVPGAMSYYNKCKSDPSINKI